MFSKKQVQTNMLYIIEKYVFFQISKNKFEAPKFEKQNSEKVAMKVPEKIHENHVL